MVTHRVLEILGVIVQRLSIQHHGEPVLSEVDLDVMRSVESQRVGPHPPDNGIFVHDLHKESFSVSM